MQEQSAPQAVGWEGVATSVLPRSDFPFWRLLETLPAGAYTCDGEGLITYCNTHAVQLWGRTPKLHDPVVHLAR
jgi:PAS domain-containing protein